MGDFYHLNHHTEQTKAFTYLNFFTGPNELNFEGWIGILRKKENGTVIYSVLVKGQYFWILPY